MFPVGVKEALCVALFTALVWAAHAALKLLVPIDAAPFAGPKIKTTRSWLAPAIAFATGGAIGYLLVLPNAPRFLGNDYRALVWNATVGPGLILLTVPLSFRAARQQLPTARMWVFLTPILMLAAAVGTATTDVFNLIVVFLPMCVAGMAGLVTAEFAEALSKQVRVPMQTVIAWAVRFSAESLLGAALALAILWR
jgi:hypothetical protein